MNHLLPMNLQLFAEPGASSTEPGAGGIQAGQQTAQQQTQASAAPAIDYTKIQQMLEGTLAAKEDTALKAYFRQQGLSQQEAEQAMADFKQQKAASQPDVAAIQQQAEQAQAALQQAKIENAATLAALELGLDAKTIPYLLKMADLSKVMGEDGKINDEAMKTALNTVLEAVPGLKPDAGKPAGFVQVGVSGTGQQTTATDDALKKAFGL